MKVYSFFPHQLCLQNKIETLVRGVDVPFQACTNPAKLLAHLSDLKAEKIEKRIFVFTDENHLDLVSRLSVEHSECTLVLILKSPLQKVAGLLAKCRSIQCYVASQNEEFEVQDVSTMLKKFKTQDIGGLEKYLGAEAHYHTMRISNSRDKETVLQELEFFVLHLMGPQNKNRSREYSRRVCELADELVLNAIFDANPRMENHSRSFPFLLSPKESVDLKWGFNGNQFGISVTDFFGRIEKDTILKFLDKDFTTQDLELQKSAGLGLKIVFERLHHLVVSVHPSVKTEVICLLRFDKRLRDFESRIRSFHFFRNDEGESA